MLIIFHLSAMIAALLCLMAGVGIAMFGRKNKNWLKIHKGLNTAGLIIALTGGAFAFASVLSYDGRHLAGLHQWIGLSSILLCGLTLYLGFHIFQAKNKITVRTAHRWSGRVVIPAMLVAITLGLQLIGVF
jgi:H+/gluconate symporter-like permease